MIGRLIQLRSGKWVIEAHEGFDGNDHMIYTRLFDLAPWYGIDADSEVPMAQLVTFWPVAYNGRIYATFE